MPKRDDVQRELIDSLPELEPGKMCNARTGNPSKPYCLNKAGFRTDHLGEGRCYLHGGLAGRPVVTAHYSKKLTSTIQDEYEKLINDPVPMSLFSELGLVRTLLGTLLKDLSDRIAEGQDIWVTYTMKGTPIADPKIKIFIDMIDSVRKLSVDIDKVMKSSNYVLTVGHVKQIVSQIQNALKSCGECPVRKSLTAKLSDLRMQPMGK